MICYSFMAPSFHKAASDRRTQDFHDSLYRLYRERKIAARRWSLKLKRKSFLFEKIKEAKKFQKLWGTVNFVTISISPKNKIGTASADFQPTFFYIYINYELLTTYLYMYLSFVVLFYIYI